MENVYEKNGYESRKDYLECQADWYGIPMDEVQYIADILGESEDFDGLITSLEDYQDGYGF
jgi:hypothetical protein